MLVNTYIRCPCLYGESQARLDLHYTLSPNLLARSSFQHAAFKLNHAFGHCYVSFSSCLLCLCRAAGEYKLMIGQLFYNGLMVRCF